MMANEHEHPKTKHATVLLIPMVGSTVHVCAVSKIGDCAAQSLGYRQAYIQTTTQENTGLLQSGPTIKRTDH